MPKLPKFAPHQQGLFLWYKFSVVMFRSAMTVKLVPILHLEMFSMTFSDVMGSILDFLAFFSYIFLVFPICLPTVFKCSSIFWKKLKITWVLFVGFFSPSVSVVSLDKTNNFYSIGPQIIAQEKKLVC